MNKSENVDNSNIEELSDDDPVVEIPLYKTEMHQDSPNSQKYEIEQHIPLPKEEDKQKITHDNPGYTAKMIPKITCEFCYKVVYGDQLVLTDKLRNSVKLPIIRNTWTHITLNSLICVLFNPRRRIENVCKHSLQRKSSTCT